MKDWLSIQFVVLVALLSLGCQSSTCPVVSPTSIVRKEIPAGLLEKAERLSDTAADRAGVLAAIRAYEAVLEYDPLHYRALVMAGNQSILLGAAYETDRGAKREAYNKAVCFCDRAMCTNPAFQQLREKGDAVHEAVDVLTVRELDAMTFWVTAVFYSFDECQNSLQNFIYQRRLRQARSVLEQASLLDPDWGGGVLHVTWGIYYLAVPPAIGGSREKSEQAFQDALNISDKRMLSRWSRARYFATKYGRSEMFKEDLEWVVSRSKEAVGDHGSWVFFMQRDAAQMLNPKKSSSD